MVYSSVKEKGIDTMKRKPSPLAKRLLNAIWDENVKDARMAIMDGADPNWIINGYPVLMHAVFTRNVEMVMMLIDNGSLLISEALGFALDRGIGEMVVPLMMCGAIPKMETHQELFGPFPSRYAPLDNPYVFQ